MLCITLYALSAIKEMGSIINLSTSRAQNENNRVLKDSSRAQHVNGDSIPPGGGLPIGGRARPGLSPRAPKSLHMGVE